MAIAVVISPDASLRPGRSVNCHALREFVPLKSVTMRPSINYCFRLRVGGFRFAKRGRCPERVAFCRSAHSPRAFFCGNHSSHIAYCVTLAGPTSHLSRMGEKRLIEIRGKKARANMTRGEKTRRVIQYLTFRFLPPRTSYTGVDDGRKSAVTIYKMEAGFVY